MESGLQSARTENVYFGRHRYVELAIAASREWNRIKFIEGIWLFRSCGYGIPFQHIFLFENAEWFSCPASCQYGGYLPDLIVKPANLITLSFTIGNDFIVDALVH